MGAIANSLLFIADDAPLLVMTSGKHRVNTDVLKVAAGATHILMATPAQVRQITGQVIGGVAPTGHPAPIRTVVDAALREYDTIWSAGGTPNTVVPLTFETLLRVTAGIASVVAAHAI